MKGRMHRRQLCALTALSVLLGTTAAYAAPPEFGNPEIVAQRPGGPGRGRGQGGQRWIEQLDLSQDQQQRIQQIRDRYRSEAESTYTQMMQLRQEMQDLMVGNGSDSQLRSKHDEMMKLHQRMGELRFDQMLEIRAVLSAEQRQQWAQQMQQRHQNRGNRQGNRPGNGRGMGPGGGMDDDFFGE
ncbi:periplasmic heavy metal sensor [Oxynema sp. CENA135]|uniref:Periplasmic heavy metal sensor n=1 Tax=Oxynema aestuarii AP17 TaxID=2064643 RepID=A0A6H1TZU2_9CYAN|nr:MULTISPECIES: Spy/CpxP family protein refolding chaperone [Oxynema]MBK4728741.1 periplasmic heavy metal sensor [Oxynema sp. CENA135]QIZ72101.1 periplasmic heavy metal sensor [Oxynema aestuarii AP17]RMH73100.1 MAG: periplasmic heavy metal sensor [Cyanobacteria bacterium J007]